MNHAINKSDIIDSHTDTGKYYKMSNVTKPFPSHQNKHWCIRNKLRISVLSNFRKNENITKIRTFVSYSRSYDKQHTLPLLLPS